MFICKALTNDKPCVIYLQLNISNSGVRQIFVSKKDKK